ncbi:MAG: methylenetetrahydrofolate--tRNA-(uracil(54)-C(5))-methyltransferase (FADH(2)-oxidizing) TrmFO, partial [Myxococcaceae bacterium]
MSNTPITVIGAGLAGSECAYQLARLGHDVVLREQKPVKRSPAHQSNAFAELVCSNSMRSDNPDSAIGMLHAELRRVGSVILHAADANRVPAGDALAVEREGFSAEVTRKLAATGRITVVPGEVTEIPDGDVVFATGPLTSEALTSALARFTGEKLYFYDAIAPIVAGDSIDMSIAFRASRYGKGDGADYLNLPLNKEEYLRFVTEVRAGQKVTPHAFEEPKYFEGCLPIEVMAERGERVLAFGPMKPVGLTDPRTGRWPYAVVQLRMEDRAGTAWNLVGFQTRLTWPEQKRIFGMLPGLQNAEWVRMGQIHRNTFLEAPKALDATLQLRARPGVYVAGQLTGVEGYVESAAMGIYAGMCVAQRVQGQEPALPARPCAYGSLLMHLQDETPRHFAPMNINWGLLLTPDEGVKMKKDGR